MKLVNFSLLIIMFLNINSANLNLEDSDNVQSNIKNCNKLLSDEKFICDDLKDLKQKDLWQNYACNNYLAQNKLQRPEELKNILELLSPQEFNQKTDRRTTLSIGCAVKRFLQYLNEYQNSLEKIKNEDNKKRVDLVLSGGLDDEILTDKMNLDIDICNELLFKDVYLAEDETECNFADLINSEDWKNSRCAMWLKLGKLNRQLDVATYKFGTTLSCFEKRQQDISDFMNQ